VLLVVLGVLALGTVLAALATSIEVLLIARAIQGTGGAIMPIAFGIVRDEFPSEKVAAGISMMAALLAAGIGLGTVLAGPIVSALGYHYLFWIPLVVIVISIIAVRFAIPPSDNRAPGSISVLPAVLLVGWLVALLVAVSKGSEWGWNSGVILGLLAAAVVLLPLWVYSEMRARYPLVDMTMMRTRAVWTTNLVALLFGAGMYAILAFIPPFVQTPSGVGYGFGASVTESGMLVLPLTVTMFLAGLLCTPMAQRWGAKVVVVSGSALTAAACVLLTVAHGDKWAIYLFSTVVGFGFGFAFSAMSTLIVDSVPRSQVGIASGMNANIRTIGGAIGTAIMSSIVASSAGPSGVATESGYTSGFAFLIGMGVLATAAALLIPRRRTTADESVVYAGEDALVAGAPLLETGAGQGRR
jgi:MFS family permease